MRKGGGLGVCCWFRGGREGFEGAGSEDFTVFSWGEISADVLKSAMEGCFVTVYVCSRHIYD